MKEIRCKAVNPCEKIVITNPCGMNRFVVKDEEIESRVNEVYFHEIVGTCSDTIISLHDEKNYVFATILIEYDGDGNKFVHFDDPDNKFIPCSRSQLNALVGCASWVRIFVHMEFDKMSMFVDRDMYCDIVGEYYYYDYIREWGKC